MGGRGEGGGRQLVGSSWAGLGAQLPSPSSSSSPSSSCSSCCPGEIDPREEKGTPPSPPCEKALIHSHTLISPSTVLRQNRSSFEHRHCPKGTLQTRVPKGSTLSNIEIEKLQNPKAVESLLWISSGAVQPYSKVFRSPFLQHVPPPSYHLCLC